ncbi:MAG: hypothetical protein ABIJ30_00545 [bacterium]
MFNKLKKAHNRLHLISTKLPENRQFRIMPIEDHEHFTQKTLPPLPSDEKIRVEMRKKKSKKTHILNFGKLTLFKDVSFEFQDDLAKNSYLVGDFCGWIPVAILMKKNGDEDKLKAVVSLEDGEVLYRFEPNGEIRLDPKYVNEVFIGKDGICSKINLNRYKKRVTIKNKSNERFYGMIETSQDWVMVDKPGLIILPGDSEEVIVTILPDKMKIGNNVSSLEIISTDSRKRKGVIAIQAEMMVYGMVPQIKGRNFHVVSHVEKGTKVRLTKALCIKVIGKGVLKGRISSSMGGICEDILVENLTPTEITIEKNIIIDTQKLSHSQGNEIKATVVTDSYIWNKRCFPLTFTFENKMIYLKTSLPVLLFPQMTSGGKKKKLSFTVTRSDNNRVDTFISIPEDLTKYVTGHKLNQNQWEIEFDATKVNPEEISHISGMIKIKDKISNMEEQIPLIAEIGGNK